MLLSHTVSEYSSLTIIWTILGLSNYKRTKRNLEFREKTPFIIQKGIIHSLIDKHIRLRKAAVTLRRCDQIYKINDTPKNPTDIQNPNQSKNCELKQ